MNIERELSSDLGGVSIIICLCPGKTALASHPISQPENTPAARPSAPGVDKMTEEKNDAMTTMREPERGNLRSDTNNANGTGESQEPRSAFQAAMEQTERTKTKLRTALNDLNEAATMLKTAQREQRGTIKEIKAVRAKLREIQNLEI